ncbi:MAG: protein translocase subunit SecF [Rhodospirillales bacterium]|jgi:preprotein translocase SecF subunit
MRPLRFVPENTAIDFVANRWPAFTFTGLLFVVTIVSLIWPGLNLGIDFRGGILIEARAERTVDVAAMRGQLNDLGLGDVDIQGFGSDRDVLIRVQMQPGGEQAQTAAIETVRRSLGTGYEYRRVELVGPTVGQELLTAGIVATVLAVIAIALYVAFRFEWQFGVAALIATFHDVFTTVGLFAVLQLEFDLTAVAALLTLAGYSINDTVVVFDRMRETMRKNKTMPLRDVINLSVNQTLSRTIMTSATTWIAILPLLIFGGAALANFTWAMTWGIFIGTFSSVYIAASILLYLPPIRRVSAEPKAEAAAPSQG